MYKTGLRVSRWRMKIWKMSSTVNDEASWPPFNFHVRTTNPITVTLSRGLLIRDRSLWIQHHHAAERHRPFVPSPIGSLTEGVATARADPALRASSAQTFTSTSWIVDGSYATKPPKLFLWDSLYHTYVFRLLQFRFKNLRTLLELVRRWLTTAVNSFQSFTSCIFNIGSVTWVAFTIAQANWGRDCVTLEL